MSKILFVATEPAPGMLPFVLSIFEQVCNIFSKEQYLFVLYDKKKLFSKYGFKESENVCLIGESLSKIKSKIDFFYPVDFIKSLKLIEHEYSPTKIVYLTGDFKLHWLSHKAKLSYIVHDLKPHEVYKLNIRKKIVQYYIRKSVLKLINKADQLITCSKSQHEVLRNAFPEKDNVLFPFPSLVSSAIVCGSKDVPELLEEPGYVLFFGSVQKYKGVDLLIEAWRSSKRNNEKLVIAGKNASSVLDLVDSNDNILLIDRYFDDNEIKSLFSRAKLIVYPYISVTMSGVLSLSYYFDKPSLVSSLQFFTDFIENDELIFEKGDIDSLVGCLNKFNENNYRKGHFKSLYDKYYSSLELGTCLKKEL